MKCVSETASVPETEHWLDKLGRLYKGATIVFCLPDDSVMTVGLRRCTPSPLHAVLCTESALLTSGDDFDLVVHVARTSPEFVSRNSYFLNTAGPKQYLLIDGKLVLLTETK